MSLLAAGRRGWAGPLLFVLILGPGVRGASTVTSTDLIRAIRGADLGKVRNEIAHGAPVNEPDAVGRTPAYWAAGNGDVEILKLLVNAGADINWTNGQRWGTPLEVSLANGHPEAARLLLDNRADIRARGTSGLSSLHAAAYGGLLEFVKLLTERGLKWDEVAPCDGTALHEASITGRTDVIQYFIDKGVDANVRAGSKITPLMAAAMYDQAPAIKVLLANGANAALVDDDGRTALQIATQRKRFAAVNALNDSANGQKKPAP